MSLNAFRAALTALLARALWPWQREWLHLLSTGRDLAVLGCRQKGKNWLLALWLALRLVSTDEEWHVVSATEGHAKKLLLDVAMHLRALRMLSGRLPAVEVQTLTAVSETGATVTAHAATGRSIIGMRGSIVLDELSALRSEDAEALYTTAEPIVTGARHAGRRAQLVILSNATRAGHWWHKAWTGDTLASFQKASLTWPEACRLQGWSEERIAREEVEIRRRVGPAAWRRWYLCEWAVEGEGYLSDVIDPARYDALPAGSERWPQLIGYDVGRTSDPSVLVPVAIAPDGTRWATPAIYLRNMPYSAQIARLRSLCATRKTLGVVIDANLNEDHWRECATALSGVAPVHPYRAGAASQWAVFQDLRADLEALRTRVDGSDAALLADLHGVEATVSDRDRPQILLPRTGERVDGREQTRHCDGAVALALANQAARQGVGRVAPPPVIAAGVHEPFDEW